MKKTVLSIAILFFAYAASAQFTTGQKLIGGQLGFSTTQYDGSNIPGSYQKYYAGGISFSLAQFKSPTSLVGFGVTYSYSDYKYSSNGNPASVQENRNNTLGAFAELVKLQPLAKKLYLSFTGTGGANYNFSKTYYQNNVNAETKGYNIYVNGGMGLWYQLNQRFVVTGNFNNLLAVSYGHGKNTTYPSGGTGVVDSKANSFSLSTGLNGFSLGNFGIGVRYLLK